MSTSIVEKVEELKVLKKNYIMYNFATIWKLKMCKLRPSEL